MKKFLIMALAAFMTLSMAACGGEGGTGSASSAASAASSSATSSASTDSDDIIIDNTSLATSTASVTSKDDKPTDIGTSGYCAVGVVDASAKTAKVVGQNGAVASVSYTGDDPAAGGLYGFSKSGDKYKFTEVTFINGSGLKDAAWQFRVLDNTGAGAPDQIYTFDGSNERLYDFTDNTVVFCRFSATEWRVFSGIDVITNAGHPCTGYFSVEANSGGGNELVNVVLIGNVDSSSGKIIGTDSANTFYFDKEGFGWKKGDITIQ